MHRVFHGMENCTNCYSYKHNYAPIVNNLWIGVTSGIIQQDHDHVTTKTAPINRFSVVYSGLRYDTQKLQFRFTLSCANIDRNANNFTCYIQFPCSTAIIVLGKCI